MTLINSMCAQEDRSGSCSCSCSCSDSVATRSAMQLGNFFAKAPVASVGLRCATWLSGGGTLCNGLKQLLFERLLVEGLLEVHA